MSDDITMTRYADWAPTGFDPKGLGLDDKQDWFVCGIGHNRDSNLLTESNWEVTCRELEEIDPESNDHDIHRFGHWANGWFEIILVRPDSACAKRCQEFMDCLSDYPILCEFHYSDKEHEACVEYWERASLSERVELCQKAKANVFAARRDEVPDGVYDELREVIY